MPPENLLKTKAAELESRVILLPETPVCLANKVKIPPELETTTSGCPLKTNSKLIAKLLALQTLGIKISLPAPVFL